MIDAKTGKPVPCERCGWPGYWSLPGCPACELVDEVLLRARDGEAVWPASLVPDA